MAVLPTRKRSTSSPRVCAWAPNCSLLEAICSLPAAACSVTWLTLWIARDFLGIGGLFDGRRGDFRDLGGGGLDAADDLLQRSGRLVAQLRSFHDALGRFLDERRDLVGGLVGSLGQLSDLIGHHGESQAVLAGPRRLDGRVEGEQIGLAGDLGDHADDLANLVRAF